MVPSKHRAPDASGPRAHRTHRPSCVHHQPGLQEGGGSSAAAARRRGRARHPEGRPGLPGVDRLARRLRQRRDPPADRGLPPPPELPGRLPRQGGRALFEIDPRQFQATYDQAKGTLAQYEATLANAKTTVARYRPLAAQKAISQQELDDAETRERTAQANVESARATLEKAKLDLDWTKVVSPIDGIAGVAKSQVGDLVNRLTVMTTVSQVDPIKVYFNPSEQEYLAWVAKHGPPEKTLQSRPGPRKGNPRAHPLGRLRLPAPRQGDPRRPRGGREDRHDPARGRVPEPGQPPASGPVRQGAGRHGRPEGSDPRAAAGGLPSCRAATRSPSSARTTR